MRRTGRTYRMLLKSLLAASEGEVVNVVVESNSYAKDLLRRAADLCRQEATVSFNYNKIEFPGKGVVYFSYPRAIRTGIHFDKIFKDEK